jgi:Bacterial Ig-like domain (group 3)/MBG domain (YGX type)
LQRSTKHFQVFLCLLLCVFSSIVARAQVSVYTRSYDNARTSANLNETILTPANVNATNFGKLFTVPVDGEPYAQPLYVANLAIAGGTHNVVFVATMLNSVYAIEADTGAVLWTKNFGMPISPAIAQTYNNQEFAQNISNITGVGIVSTPVIDPGTNIMYFVTSFQYQNNGVTQFARLLNALDITTGNPYGASPVNITATYTTADITTPLVFNPLRQNNRPGLALANGNVYIAFGSHDDIGPYNGWVLAYSASTLAQVAVFSDTTVGSLGGIWSAGQAPVVDSAGNLYFSTGNGSFGTTTNNLQQVGNSFIKLSPTLQLMDYFTPFDSAAMNSGDADLGSSGLVMLPNTNYVLGGGKQGILYLADTTALGGFNAGGDKVHQEFQAIYGKGTSHIHGTPSYFNSPVNGPTAYVWGENDVLRAYTFNATTGLMNATPVAMSTMTAPTVNNNGAMPGGFTSISANGNTNGILWASTPYLGDAAGSLTEGVLYAFDANTLDLLWTDKTNDARDEIGVFAKYVQPVVANGKMYIPNFTPVNPNTGSGNLVVYGLLKPQLTVAVANANSTVGAPLPTLTGSVTGLQNGDTVGTTIVVTYTTTATTASPAGTYPITATVTGSSANNYTVVVNAGTLTIAAAGTQTITFPPVAPHAYGSAFAVTATSSLGAAYPVTITVQSGPATINNGMVTVIGVGSVTLLATQAGDANHAAATATQTFQATQATLTVTASNATRAFNTANPAFTGTITGAVGSDTFVETFTTTAITTSNAGSYPIVPAVTGPVANYSVTLVNGALTVTGAKTTTTLTAPATAVEGTSITLSATVASTLGTPAGTVTFNNGSSALGTATLNGGVATLNTMALPVGTDTVTATYSAAGNYGASTSAGVAVTISPAVAPSYAVTASPTSLTIAQGSNGSTTLTVTGSGSYTGTIAWNCTGLPANATCSFAQNQISLKAGTQSVTTGLTINTTAQQAQTKASPSPLMGLAFWFPGSLTGLALFARRRKLAVLCLFVLVAGLTGCGGGSMSGGGSSTTPVTSQVSIVATGTAGSTVTTKTVTLSLTMTQ